jgi:two-component system LytT family response regulator
MKLGVVIVDDEPLSRLGVATRLAEHPDMEVLGECQDGETAIRLLSRCSPDVVFLDIEMPGISGLDLLRALPQGQIPCVVFITAHEEHAVEAFSVEATDFLLKPINNSRFAACLDRVRRLIKFRRREAHYERLYGPLEQPVERNGQALERFTVRRGKHVHIIQAAEIDWIEGLGDYAGLHVGKSTHLIRKPLSTLASRLEPGRFVRIHRSTIVQVDRINSLEALTNRDSLVILRDGVVLRASRTYAPSLQRLLKSD